MIDFNSINNSISHTKNQCSISSRWFFTANATPELLLLRHQEHEKKPERQPEKPQKTLMRGTAPRIFLSFSWNLYLKIIFIVDNSKPIMGGRRIVWFWGWKSVREGKKMKFTRPTAVHWLITLMMTIYTFTFGPCVNICPPLEWHADDDFNFQPSPAIEIDSIKKELIFRMIFRSWNRNWEQNERAELNF